jgi:hypothetical protein
VTVVRRWVATAVVVPLLVAGCSDDPEPRFEPSPSPSPTESTSEPAQPQAWEVKSEAGAVAFAKHWIDVFNEAMPTGDTRKLESLSEPACKTCTAFAKRLESIYASGGFYESPGWRILQADASDNMPAGRAVLALRVRQGSERYKDTADSKIVENRASKASYSANLVWTGGTWRVRELRLVG